MAIGVCIVNYNTRDLLHDCLYSVLAEAPDEVAVIDNASADGSAEMVESEFPSVRLLRNHTNPGYGAAANRAVRCCTSGYVLLLNSDTRLKAGSLQALSHYLDTHPRAAVVGPRMVNPDGTSQTSCFHFPTPFHIFLYITRLHEYIQTLPNLRNRSLQAWSLSTARRVPWVLGAALGIRRTPFEMVGGFDESFFMYFEEVDLCYRLARAGWEVHFAPVTEVTHLGGASTQQDRLQMNLQYFTSLKHFYRRHYSPFRMAQLALVVTSTAMTKVVKDRIRLLFTRDAQERSELAFQLQVWQRLLLRY